MFGISKGIVESRRQRFAVGSRVRLVSMNDRQAPPPGTEGTVRCVDDIGTVHVAWDNGSSLGAAYGEDVIVNI